MPPKSGQIMKSNSIQFNKNKNKNKNKQLSNFQKEKKRADFQFKPVSKFHMSCFPFRYTISVCNPCEQAEIENK